MAATIFQSLICLIILSSIPTPVHIFSTHSSSSSSLQQNLPKFLATECLLQILTAPKIISLTGSVGFHRSCYAVGYWSKHGYISLCIPGHDPPINITIYNDVSSNPGPQSSILDYEHDQSEINDHSKFKSRGSTSNSVTHLHITEPLRFCYSRQQLLEIRRKSTAVRSADVLKSLKKAGILRYRGKRAGKLRIPVIITARSPNYNIWNSSIDTRNINNLIHISLKRAPPSNGPRLRFALWNARSVKNKISSLCDLIISEHIDICAVTETWLTRNDPFILADLVNTLQDYTVYSLPRASRGGGVAVIARKGLGVKENKNSSISLSFEILDLTITSGNKQFRLITIYRPRATKKNKLTTQLFFSKFSKLLEDLIATPHKLMLTGDFNFHVDNPDNTEARNFLDLLNSAGFEQHFDGPTHCDGHTLDLIITRNHDNFTANLRILPELPSDHRGVLCNIDLPRPAPTRKCVIYRKLRSIDMETFSNDITSSFVNITGSDLDSLYGCHNETLSCLLDKHAPLQSRKIILRPNAPWYNDELRKLKCEKRRFERRYVNFNLTVHKQMYQVICTKYTSHLEAAKTEYLKKKSENSSDN